MRRALSVASVVLLLFVSAGQAWGGVPTPLMSNSPHDLSSGSTADIHDAGTGAVTTSRVCVFCHTPHGATTGAAPLWNKPVAAAGTYTMYTSSTLEGTMEADPTTTSLACLACHDGATAALDVMNNLDTAQITAGQVNFTDPSTNLTGTLLTGGNAALDQDLRDDHPVGVQVLGNPDVGIEAVATIEAAGLPLFGANETVECGTCHSSHDNTIPMFLRVTTTNSQLCATCHINK